MKTLHASLAVAACAGLFTCWTATQAQVYSAVPGGAIGIPNGTPQMDQGVAPPLEPFPAKKTPTPRAESNTERLERKMHSMDATAGTLGTGEDTAGSAGSAGNGTAAAPAAPKK